MTAGLFLLDKAQDSAPRRTLPPTDQDDNPDDHGSDANLDSTVPVERAEHWGQYTRPASGVPMPVLCSRWRSRGCGLPHSAPAASRGVKTAGAPTERISGQAAVRRHDACRTATWTGRGAWPTSSLGRYGARNAASLMHSGSGPHGIAVTGSCAISLAKGRFDNRRKQSARRFAVIVYTPLIGSPPASAVSYGSFIELARLSSASVRFVGY